jgi:hypothetical protein
MQIPAPNISLPWAKGIEAFVSHDVGHADVQ